MGKNKQEEYLKYLLSCDIDNKKPCIRIVNENLTLVYEGLPLTKPLSFLNKSCEFRTKYRHFMNYAHGTAEEVKERMREYKQRPEVKARARETQKVWWQKNKKKRKAYNKKYHEKNKEKIKEYKQKPEVKAKRKEWRQKPENKLKKKEYDRKYAIKKQKLKTQQNGTPQ